MIRETITEFDRNWGVLIDVDVVDASTWSALFRTGHELVVRTARRSFRFPSNVAYPLIRCLDPDRVLVVDACTHPDRANAWVLGGDESDPFFVGDGIQDVLASRDTIVITYFDEGIFHNLPPGPEGVAVFDDTGRYRGGYHSKLGTKAVQISDCYAACWVDDTRIAFLPYMEFPLVTLDVMTFDQGVVATPSSLHSSHSMSAAQDGTFLFGPSRRRASIARWSGGAKIETIGSHGGPLRGLRGGRFIAHSAHAFTIAEP